MLNEMDYTKIKVLKKASILCQHTKSDFVNNIIRNFIDNSEDEELKSFIDNLEIGLNKTIEEIATGILGGANVN